MDKASNKPTDLLNTTNTSLNKTLTPNEKRKQFTFKKCKTNHKSMMKTFEGFQGKKRDEVSNFNNNYNNANNNSFHNQTFTSDSVKPKPRIPIQLKICSSFIENKNKKKNHLKERLIVTSPRNRLHRKLSYELAEVDENTNSNGKIEIKYNTKTHISGRKMNSKPKNKERLLNIYKYLAKNEIIKELEEPNTNTNNNNSNGKDNFNLTADNLKFPTTTKNKGNKRNNIKYLPFCSLKEQKTISAKKALYPIKGIQISKRPATVIKSSVNNKHHKGSDITNADNTIHKKILTGNNFNKMKTLKITHNFKLDAETSMSTESSVFLGRIEDYIIGKEIGKGAYAVVKQALHKPTNRKMAIKIYEKSALVDIQKKRTVKKEIEIMKCLDHGNIVKLYEIIESSRQVRRLNKLLILCARYS